MATQWFASRFEHNVGERFPSSNRPAKVAMGRKDSYTAGPDCIAARHTDARSLAMPVSRGTMNRTRPLVPLITRVRARLRSG